MNKQQYLRQLKDRDPDKRKAAVKAAARALDRDALKRLAVMCDEDPDPEVRELALRAGAFIRKQLDGGGDADPTVPAKKQVIHVAVTPEDEARAQQIVNAALSAQMNGQKAKAMKLLSQALALDPNLRHDGYFINLAETTTGRLGEGASVIKLLSDKKEQENISQQETHLRQQSQNESHMQEVSKIQWASVGFDMMLFTLAAFIGSALFLFLIVQSASGYVQRYETNVEQVALARAEGRVTRSPQGEEILLSTETDPSGRPRPLDVMNPDPDFLANATQTQQTEFTTILIAALGAAVVATVLLVILTALTHVISVSILRGQGNMPYLVHRVTTMLTTRAIVVFILMGVGAIIFFDGGNTTIITIFAGLIGIFSLVMVFTVVGITGKAYNFSAVKGLIAVLPGMILIGAVIGGVITLL